MTENTSDSILLALEAMARSKEPIDPTQWVEGASKLVALMSDEHNKLFMLEQQVARQRVELIENGFTVAKARAFVEANEEYRTARMQKAKIDRILETIRLAKLRGRMAQDEYRSQ